MAEKVEKKEFEKKSKLVEVFSKEYKYEGLILLVLALVAVTLGVLIVSDIMTIPTDVFLLGEYPKFFAWTLIALGGFSMLLAIFPYYKPSIVEVKRVTWPTKKLMLENTAQTFIFIIAFSLFFWGCDTLLSFIVSLIS